jgi:GH15 family glucan-1,4-alpha-glucosidase
VDWWCVRRFDAPSTFGRLLGPEAGHWTLGPASADDYTVERAYLGYSLVLETTHRSDGGTMVVTDALVVPHAGDSHDLGRDAPLVLVRHVRCTDGAVRGVTEFAPRPDYGLGHPALDVHDDGSLHTIGVSGEVEWQLDGSTAHASFDLQAGDEVGFAMQWHDGAADTPHPMTLANVHGRLRDSQAAWNDWDGAHGAYDGPYQREVNLSARVLQGLAYAPSGATIAAATTSLAEAPGAGRTWDYRYSWLRDAALTMRAQYVAACPEESAEFFDWALRAATDTGSGTVQIVYGVEGERMLPETELEHLPGWRDTGPVRVGNEAWKQTQHDVYGEMLDAAWLLRDQAGPYVGVCADFLAGLADEAVRVWREPDSGLWEQRGEPEHYVASKAMCWVALDRASRLQRSGDLEATSEQAERWSQEADELLDDICDNGFNQRVGAFTQAYGSDDLDAAALLLVIYDVLPRDDDRIRSTVEAVESGLDRDGLLVRYTTDDDLPGTEGAFLLCSFWLAEAWARLGDPARARVRFDRAAGFANDLGIMAEEANPVTGELVGNYPQAFSHTGLVNAAWAIGEAEAGRPHAVLGEDAKEHA